MDIETLNTDGITIRYFRFGNEYGQPFIVIPGISLRSVIDSADFTARHYKALAESFSVYVFDRREDMPEEYSIYDMADDTAKAMDALGLKDAVIYGVSQGGMIAQAISIRRPELVSRLALCSTAPYIPEQACDILASWAENTEKNDRTELMLVFAESVYSTDYCERYKKVFPMFSKLLTERDLERFIITVKGSRGFDVREKLCCIKCPLLVIAGDKDRIFGAEASRELAELANGELCIYPGQAHALYDEEPDVIRRIKDFALNVMAKCQ
ncbi:MAG: alpha/beta fold hydrolase [Ruminococcus sp.]|nr:alpha/beta fold hydrolase [Ruminococcus sp.]